MLRTRQIFSHRRNALDIVNAWYKKLFSYPRDGRVRLARKHLSRDVLEIGINRVTAFLLGRSNDKAEECVVSMLSLFLGEGYCLRWRCNPSFMTMQDNLITALLCCRHQLCIGAAAAPSKETGNILTTVSRVLSYVLSRMRAKRNRRKIITMVGLRRHGHESWSPTSIECTVIEYVSFFLYSLQSLHGEGSVAASQERISPPDHICGIGDVLASYYV